MGSISLASIPDYFYSAPARKAANLLRALGFVVDEEWEIGPYSLDIYLPEIHAAVEIDGPHHLKSRDDRRDAVLLDQYFIPTFRFKIKMRFTNFDKAFREFLEEWNDSAGERLMKFDQLDAL